MKTTGKMKNKTTILHRACFVLTAALCFACSESYVETPVEEVPNLQELRMSGKLEEAAKTRALDKFPHDEKIAVVATATPSGSTIAGVSWEHRLIDHVTAKVTSTTSTKYNFDWVDATQANYLWPEQSDLLFMAYAPADLPTTEATLIWRDGVSLHLQHNADNTKMPDVIYADGTIVDKANKSVDFGTFRHVFSQVSIKLKGKEVNPHISLARLALITSKKGVYHLPTRLLTPEDENLITYELTSGLPASLGSNEFKLEAGEDIPFYVFPDTDTQSYTQIAVTLSDASLGGEPIIINRIYDIAEFSTASGGHAKLERATKTTLVISINGTIIGTGVESAQLTAESEQWSNNGDYGININ